MKLSTTLMLLGGLVLGGTGVAIAGAASGTVNNMAPATFHKPVTIGEQLANGSMTEQQVAQLIQFTGLTPDAAKSYTVSQVSAMRWENN